MATYLFIFIFFIIIYFFFNFEQSGILLMWPSRDQVMWPSQVAYPGMAFFIVVLLSTRDPWAMIPNTLNIHWIDYCVQEIEIGDTEFIHISK